MESHATIIFNIIFIQGLFGHNETVPCHTAYTCGTSNSGDLIMKQLTIREAREGLSHPEAMFADTEEILVVCRGEPIARILPVNPKRKVRSLAAFRATQPFQDVPSEVIISEDREDRC